MIASLLFGLDSDLRGFKDQILASETLPTTANTNSRLLHSSLGQHSTVTSMESSALVLSSGDRGSSCGGFRGGHGGCGSRGGSRTGGGTNHTEPYCWVKYSKPDNYIRSLMKLLSHSLLLLLLDI